MSDERQSIDGAAAFLAREIHSDVLATESDIKAAIAGVMRRFITPGVEKIADERSRQIHVEGWGDDHDDEHDNGEMALAAARYACKHVSIVPDADSMSSLLKNALRVAWPWEQSWWKPSKDPIRNLEKAGALIAAEIERRLRAKARL